MKSKQILAILGSLFILLSSIIPLAKLDNRMITYLPVWNNFNIEQGLWQWRDISFFAVTLILASILSMIFSIKKLFTGLLFTGFISLFIIFILFMAIFEIKGRLVETNGVSFSFDWGWVILLAGIVMILLSGSKRFKYLS